MSFFAESHLNTLSRFIFLFFFLLASTACTERESTDDREVEVHDVEEPQSIEIKKHTDIRIPMRDNVELSANIWRPVDDSRYPTILVRNPYKQSARFLERTNLGEFFGTKGYAVVIQDVRGQGLSDGVFQHRGGEGIDGYDTVEWIADQSWSNGRVCMMGLSYLGVVQWLAAKEKPPHLKCILPAAAPGFPFESTPYRGGAFLTGLLAWAYNNQGNDFEEPLTEPDWSSIYKHRPMKDRDLLVGQPLPVYQNWMAHPTMDQYWQSVSLTSDDFATFDIPVLTLSGWFDTTLPGAMSYWYSMQDFPGAKQHYLLLGPWKHAQTFVGGETSAWGHEFSEDSVLDMREVALGFFDRFLKEDPQASAPPKARIYVTGENRWREFNAFPPEQSQFQSLYLNSLGQANTASGDGWLSWDKPGAQPSDVYVYNPEDPAPTHPSDEGKITIEDREGFEHRQDILVYTSEPLDEPLTVIGPVSLLLYAASSTPDTDFIARLMEVDPEGNIRKPNAGDGVLRARFRAGYEEELLLTPGKKEQYLIKLNDIAHQFSTGNRIRLEITSSSVPAIEPNTNTGNPPATDVETLIATQTIMHHLNAESRLLLPVFDESHH